MARRSGTTPVRRERCRRKEVNAYIMMINGRIF
jgi:hypothetical protein